MRFEFFLARELGFRSVRQMKAGLTAAEIVEWTAYYLAIQNPERVQALADDDVEDKLRKAFGKRRK